MLTLDAHMRELKLLREMAKGKDDIKAAIAAEVKRGELRQFYVKRVETGGPGAFSELNDEELQHAILEQTRELGRAGPRVCETVGATEARDQALEPWPTSVTVPITDHGLKERFNS
jgi:hypothetical protein